MSPDANVQIIETDSDNNTFSLVKESIEVSTYLMSDVGQLLIFTTSKSQTLIFNNLCAANHLSLYTLGT